MTRRTGWGVLLLVVVVSLTGCLADPRLAQTAELFEHLTAAQHLFAADNPESLTPACNLVGDVQTRLVGEPGLADARTTTYAALRDAAAALQAVCGQATVLAAATEQTPATRSARDRWTDGIQRELAVACDHLGEAAATLQRLPPCR